MTGIDPSWLVGLGGLGLGATAALGQAVVDLTAWAMVLPGRRPGALAASLQDRLGPVDASGEPIEAVASDGARLRGDWRPAAGASRGAVLLLHGFAESPQGRRDRAETLRNEALAAGG